MYANVQKHTLQALEQTQTTILYTRIKIQETGQKPDVMKTQNQVLIYLEIIVSIARFNNGVLNSRKYKMKDVWKHASFIFTFGFHKFILCRPF